MSAAGVVVVGGGLAAVWTARALRQEGYTGPVTLLSEELHPPYDRPPLSKQFLAGAVTAADLPLLSGEEVADLRLDLRLGVQAEGLDTVRQEVVVRGGERVAYDALVIATGARARRLPLGAGLSGVHYLRSLDDAQQLAAELLPGRRMALIGAGFIGLEVAATAASAGLTVTVLEAASQPLSRVFGADAGWAVTQIHVGHGVDVRCGVHVEALDGVGRVSRVVCSDGAVIDVDVVVVGVGAQPNVEWVSGSGVAVDDGVVCDEQGRTSASRVFAVGDVSRWRNVRDGRHVRVEQWQTAVDQARVVAGTVAHELGVDNGGGGRWDAVPYFWSDQYDHKIQFCGSPGPVVRGRALTRGTVTAFGDGETGSVTGVLVMDNPGVLARGRRLLAAGATWTRAVAWLDGLA